VREIRGCQTHEFPASAGKKPAFKAGFSILGLVSPKKLQDMRGANLPAHPPSLPIFPIPVESLVVFRGNAVAGALYSPRGRQRVRA